MPRNLLVHLLILVLAAAGTVAAAPVFGIRYFPTNLDSEYSQALQIVEMIKRQHPTPHVYLISTVSRNILPFADSGVPINLYLEDPDNVHNLSTGKEGTLVWLKEQLPNHPATTLNITAITFGRKMFSQTRKTAQRTLDTLDNLSAACKDLGLKGVRVTTALSFDMFTTAFPPSAAEINPEFASNIKRLLHKLNSTGAPLQVELLPHDLLKAGAVKGADLRFALFEIDPRSDLAMVDPETGARYGNMFDMMLDSVFSSLKKAGYGEMVVEVTAAGWPSNGPLNTLSPPGISALTSGEYVGRLLSLLIKRKGTPMRPDGPGPAAVYLETLVDGSDGRLQYGIVDYFGQFKYPIAWDGNYAW